MIARIVGRLEQVETSKALLDTGGGLWYEVFVPAYSLDWLGRRVGQEIVLYTLHYLEGDPARGNLVPRLVGLPNETDRRFLELFTSVKGIGLRKALRALARPVADVAAAIVAEDADALTALPEIGKRTAQQIIAELHDRLDDFAAAATVAAEAKLNEAGLQAVTVLIQLGEKRADATALVDRALAVAPELDSPEAIIQCVYRLKAGS